MQFLYEFNEIEFHKKIVKTYEIWYVCDVNIKVKLNPNPTTYEKHTI
jgi:hypothetical protein